MGIQTFTEFENSNPKELREWLARVTEELKTSSNEVDKPKHLNKGEVWGKDVRTIFKKIIFEVFNRFADNTLLQDVDIILTGSLAKDWATPYSDVDAICLINTQDEEKIKKIKRLMEFVYYFMDEVHDKCRMLCSDPAGINIFKFCLTYDDVEKKFKSLEFSGDIELVCKSFLRGARILIGNDGENFSKLQRFFSEQYTKNQHQDEIKQEIIKNFYQNAVEEFNGPRIEGKIHIKNDILRPLDAILSAIRYEFGYMTDAGKIFTGNYLPTSSLVTDMLRKELMSPYIANLIQKTACKAMELRFKYHKESKGEQDDVYITEDNKQQIQALLSDIALLRGLAKRRLDASNQSQKPEFKFDKFPYEQDPPFVDSEAGCKITEDHKALKQEIENISQLNPDKSSEMARCIQHKGVDNFEVNQLKTWGEAIGKDKYIKLSTILPQTKKETNGSGKYVEYDSRAGKRSKQRTLLLSIVYHRIKAAETYKEVTEILDELSNPKYDWVFARREKDVVGTLFGYHWQHKNERSKAKSYAWMQVVKMAKNRTLELVEDEVKEEKRAAREERRLSKGHKLKIDGEPAGHAAKMILGKNRDRRKCVTKSLLIHSLLTNTYYSGYFRKVGKQMLENEKQSTEKWFEKETNLKL